jgi:hypothetical protein
MPKIEKLSNNDIDINMDHIIFSIDPGKENFACRLEERVGNNINPLIYIKIKLGENALIEITKFFEDHEYLLSKTTLMIVERQMPINYRMVRVSQHCETYFLTKYPKVVLFEISPKLKAEKKICVSTAINILERGGDKKSIELLNMMKKNKDKIDDLADTVCQIEAFLIEYKTLKTVPFGPSCFKKVLPKKKKKLVKNNE